MKLILNHKLPFCYLSTCLSSTAFAERRSARRLGSVNRDGGHRDRVFADSVGGPCDRIARSGGTTAKSPGAGFSDASRLAAGRSLSEGGFAPYDTASCLPRLGPAYDTDDAEGIAGD